VVTTPVTPGITPVATATPGAAMTEKVRTDRNYINLTGGDVVEIKYKVESQGKVTIRIYNLSGEEIRGFNENSLSPGTYSQSWDGSNSAGKKVGKGIYFIAVNQPGGRTIKKIIVTK
jgi:flagellar hook assembly protein FlgD